jgi:hypothetical protein
MTLVFDFDSRLGFLVVCRLAGASGQVARPACRAKLSMAAV